MKLLPVGLLFAEPEAGEEGSWVFRWYTRFARPLRLRRHFGLCGSVDTNRSDELLEIARKRTEMDAATTLREEELLDELEWLESYELLETSGTSEV